jgi:hypothetical protein
MGDKPGYRGRGSVRLREPAKGQNSGNGQAPQGRGQTLQGGERGLGAGKRVSKPRLCSTHALVTHVEYQDAVLRASVLQTHSRTLFF